MEKCFICGKKTNGYIETHPYYLQQAQKIYYHTHCLIRIARELKEIEERTITDDEVKKILKN